MNLKASFVEYLIQKYPHFNQELLQPLISENLLSPFQITLSAKQVQTIRTEIRQYWNLRQWSVDHLGARYDRMQLRRPENFGVCMSYDFHLSREGQGDGDGEFELIEINTNASFLALGLELYRFLNLKEFASDFTEQKMLQMFLEENRLAHSDNATTTSQLPPSPSNGKSFKLAILDENPKIQRLYAEFLIYQSILQKNGFACDIADIEDINRMKSSTLVYNRYTDFYLQEKKSAEIKKLFNDGAIELSPNPYEYFLLADKERLIDWWKQKEIERPKSLLPTYDLGVEDKDEMWASRKKLFFKPKNAFGGKQTYKGSSISHKVFESVMNSNFIAQKMSFPPEIEVVHKGSAMKFRYDLRCYAYQDQLQLIVARLYQGQTTNLKTEGGGFACVLMVDG